MDLQPKPHPWDLVFLALAHHDLGQAKEAQAVLHSAEQRFAEVQEERRSLPASQRRRTWQKRPEDELLLTDARSLIGAAVN